MSTHVALDNQTYSALAQHTQITMVKKMVKGLQGKLGKKTFFVNSEILGIQIWQEKKPKLQQI